MRDGWLWRPMIRNGHRGRARPVRRADPECVDPGGGSRAGATRHGRRAAATTRPGHPTDRRAPAARRQPGRRLGWPPVTRSRRAWVLAHTVLSMGSDAVGQARPARHGEAWSEGEVRQIVQGGCSLLVSPATWRRSLTGSASPRAAAWRRAPGSSVVNSPRRSTFWWWRPTPSRRSASTTTRPRPRISSGDSSRTRARLRRGGGCCAVPSTVVTWASTGPTPAAGYGCDCPANAEPTHSELGADGGTRTPNLRTTGKAAPIGSVGGQGDGVGGMKAGSARLAAVLGCCTRRPSAPDQAGHVRLHLRSRAVMARGLERAGRYRQLLWLASTYGSTSSPDCILGWGRRCRTLPDPCRRHHFLQRRERVRRRKRRTLSESAQAGRSARTVLFTGDRGCAARGLEP
jgi:hypothetical protein